MAENNKNHAPVAASLNLDDERAKFEAHFGPKDSFAWRNTDGTYKVYALQSAWEIWQAARCTPPAEVSADTLPAGEAK